MKSQIALLGEIVL